MAELFKILYVIIGGLIGIAGSFITIWYQTQKTRQIRFDQLLAEKQVDAIHEANSKLNYIEGMILQSSPEKTSEEILGYNKWFFANCSYLPDGFSKKWCSIRDTLLKVKQQTNRDSKDSNKLSELESYVQKTIGEAKNILAKEFKR